MEFYQLMREKHMFTDGIRSQVKTSHSHDILLKVKMSSGHLDFDFLMRTLFLIYITVMRASALYCRLPWATTGAAVIKAWLEGILSYLKHENQD